MSNAIFNLLAEDKDLIIYRKSLNKITGGVTSTILLQQIIYWYKKCDRRPFYKFRAPCNHRLYTSGFSWTEELGFSPSEFDTAISRIGTKITKGVSKSDAMKKTDATGLVLYWTDANRVTWYSLNVELLCNLGKLIYLENEESEITLKGDNGNLPLSETPPETPQEENEPPPSDFELIQSAIKEACKVASSDSNKGKLYKATREAMNTGKAPEQIIKFGEWFNEKYWPGKWPSIGQISTDWPKFEESIKPNGNGNGETGQEFDPIPIYNDKGERVGTR